jgi:hypothetical protein
MLSLAIDMDDQGEGKITTTTTTKVEEDPLEFLLSHLVEKPLRYQLSQPAHKNHHHHHDVTTMNGTATTITTATAGDYENRLLDASDDDVGPGTWDLLMAAYATLGMAEKVMDCFEILVGGGGGGKGGKSGSKGMMTKSEERMNSVSETGSDSLMGVWRRWGMYGFHESGGQEYRRSDVADVVLGDSVVKGVMFTMGLVGGTRCPKRGRSRGSRLESSADVDVDVEKEEEMEKIQKEVQESIVGWFELWVLNEASLRARCKTYGIGGGIDGGGVSEELSSSKSRSSSGGGGGGGGLGMDLETMGSLWKVPKPRRMRVKAVPLDSEWVDETGIEIEDDGTGSAVEALEVGSKEGGKSEMKGGEEEEGGGGKRAMKEESGEMEESEIEGEFDIFYESLIEGWLIAGGEVDVVKEVVKRIRERECEIVLKRIRE